jgi:hypothetical protein
VISALQEKAAIFAFPSQAYERQSLRDVAKIVIHRPVAAKTKAKDSGARFQQ